MAPYTCLTTDCARHERTQGHTLQCRRQGRPDDPQGPAQPGRGLIEHCHTWSAMPFACRSLTALLGICWLNSSTLPSLVFVRVAVHCLRAVRTDSRLSCTPAIASPQLQHDTEMQCPPCCPEMHGDWRQGKSAAHTHASSASHVRQQADFCVCSWGWCHAVAVVSLLHSSSETMFNHCQHVGAD